MGKTTVVYAIASLIVLAHVVCASVLKSACLLTNRNSLAVIFLWGVALALYWSCESAYVLLIPIVVFIVNEVLFWYAGVDAYSSAERTKLFYDLTTANFVNKEDGNTNLTEGLYLRDVYDDRSVMSVAEARRLGPARANDNMFRRMFADFGLHRLTRARLSQITLLDIGCGNGDLMGFFRRAGLRVVGLTISPEQHGQLRRKGFDVSLGDYHDYHSQYGGQIDIITAIGCLEHIASARACSRRGIRRENSERRRVFGHFKRYLKRASPFRTVLCTTLHINPRFCSAFNSYLMERAYGGWYHIDAPGQRMPDKLGQEGFRLEEVRDTTVHYYLASASDDTHFGVPGCVTFNHVMLSLLAPLVNPQCLALVLYTLRGVWMWQFDGSAHYCNDPPAKMQFVRDHAKRPATLYWYRMRVA